MNGRKKNYRDEIEKEVLSLNPSFEDSKKYVTFDDKIIALRKESGDSINWINLLNYQTKLQHLNSMKNMNMLKHGRNRYKFADLYTIGFTPIIKSTHYVSARLYELNLKLKNNLGPYKSECQAPLLNLSYFKAIAQKVSTYKELKINLNSLKKNVKVYKSNLAVNLNNKYLHENEKDYEWAYLQQYPANYNYTNPDVNTVDDNSDLPTDNLLNFNWYKCLVVCEDDLVKNTVTITGIITYKDSVNENKLKFKILSAELVSEIHDKIAPTTAISDTMLNKSYTDDKLDKDFKVNLKVFIFQSKKINNNTKQN